MKTYPKYLLLAAPHSSVETPSWMVDGLNRKMYFEAFNRAVQNLPSNPKTQAGVMGREDGTKKLTLIRLVTGEENEPIKDQYDYDESPF